MIHEYLNKFKQLRQKQRRLIAVFLVLALVVSIGVTWSLKLDGIAITNEAFCGLEEHEHCDECYETELVCTLEESEGHEHNDACYTDGFICGLEECEGHTHTEACYSEAYVCGLDECEAHAHTEACYSDCLVCTLEEGEEHTHSDACYEKQLSCPLEETAGHTHSDACLGKLLVCPLEECEAHTHSDACVGKLLVCPLEEGEAHTHSEACYQQQLICGLEEHIHTALCYSNNEADLETASVWESTLPALSGEPLADVVAVARSQLGYHESSLNFVLAEDGVTRKGYTRYGAWYGNDYGDWNAMFASFCLYYAGVSVPYSGGSYSWAASLKTLGLYADAALAEPEAGDLMFLDENCDGSADAVAIIAELNAVSATVIRGDYNDEVKSLNLNLPNSSIIGYGLISSLYAENSEDLSDEDFFDEDELSDEELMELLLSMSNEDLGIAMMAEGSTIALQYCVNDSGIFVSVQKQVYEDGNLIWKDCTEFTEDDEVRVSLSCRIDGTKVVAGVSNVTYELPAGISISEVETGSVYDVNNNVVGKYTITTDGKITVDFNDSWVNNKSDINLSVMVQGTVSKNDGEDSTEWNFPGTGTTITVTPPSESEAQHDNKTQKTAVLSKDGKTIQYTITVTTTKGSDTLWLSDTLTNATYQQNSLQITKKDSDGTNTTLYSGDYTVSYGNTDDGKATMNVTNLPALADSTESYEITYTVDVNENAATTDGALSVGNWASVNYQSGQTTTEISKSKVSKSGYYDANTGKIKWTIVVNEGKENISGWTLTDALENGLRYVGDFTMTDSSYNTQIISPTINDSSFTYTFPEGSGDIYTITYYTTAPEGENASVKNNVELKKDEDNKYTTGVTVGVSHRPENLHKSAAGATIEDTTASYTWNANITLAEKAFKDYDTITYTDTIVTPTTPEGAQHYGTASEITAKIDETIKFTYVDRSTGDTVTKQGSDCGNYFTYTVTCYDAAGNEVTGDAHVASFVVTVTPSTSLDENIYGNNIEFSYLTTATFAGLAEGDTVTFENKGNLNDVEVNASQSYTKPKSLEKFLVDGYDQSGEVTKEYTGAGQILTYKVVVKVAKGTENIVLTDTLPKGVEFVELTGSELWTEDNPGWKRPTLWVNSSEGNKLVYDLEGKQRPSASSNGQTVSITISPCEYDLWIYISYQVKLTDAIWSSDTDELVVLNNTVVGLDSTDSQSTTITREPSVVKKSVVQLTGTDGKPTNVLQYTVVINPGAEDLDPHSDYITLVDQLTGGAIDAAYLQLSNLKLYSYDKTNADRLGQELDSSLYQIVYNNSDPKNPSFQLTIPDQQALVLVYTYNVDIGNFAEPAVSNSVSLSGYSSSQENTQLQTNTSSASASMAVLKIYKVDAGDYSKLLQGAVFKIEKYENEEWGDLIKDKTTDENGTLQFSVGDNEATITPNTVYRLVETTAPEGYALDETPRYFCCLDGTVPKTDISNPSGVDISQVAFFGKEGGEMYIPNESTSIKVTKIWQDSDGNPIAAGAESVEVALSRQTKKLDGYHVTVEYYGDQFASGSPAATQTYFVEKDSSLEFNITGVYGGPYTFYFYMDGVEYGSVTSSTDKTFVTYKINSIEKDCTIKIGAIWALNGQTAVTYTHPAQYIYGTAETVGTVTLNAGNSWSYTWTDLAKTNAARETYYYTVTEVNVPEGWSVSYGAANGQVQSGVIPVINTKPTDTSSTTQIGVQKVWLDYQENPSTPAVSQITFELWQTPHNGEEAGDEVLYGTYTIDASTSWIKTLKNLPYHEFDSEGKVTKTYTYSVKEVNAGEGVEVKYSENNEDGVSMGNIVITNTKPKNTITVQKLWKDTDGNPLATPPEDAINYTLYQKSSNGVATEYATGTLSAENEWKASYTGLPEVDENDSNITYTYYVRETTPGYAVTYSSNNTEGITNGTLKITNKVELTWVEVEKKWVDGEGTTVDNPGTSSITFDLFQLTSDTPPSSGTVILTVKTGAYYAGDAVIDNQSYQTGSTLQIVVNSPYGSDPTVQSNGTPINYISFKEYPWTTSWGSPQVGKIFTYQITIDQDQTVMVWNYGDGSATVKVVDPTALVPDNGTLYRSGIAISSANGWETTVENLPRTGVDANGTKVHYSYYVKENNADKYSPAYTNNDGIAEGTITITNTVSNTPSYELPQSGGTGTLPYTMGGLLLAAGASFLLYRQTRRKEEG